jgi:hypothetical protein
MRGFSDEDYLLGVAAAPPHRAPFVHSTKVLSRSHFAANAPASAMSRSGLIEADGAMVSSASVARVSCGGSWPREIPA